MVFKHVIVSGRESAVAHQVDLDPLPSPPSFRSSHRLLSGDGNYAIRIMICINHQ